MGGRKSSRLRRRVLWLMLACAAVEPATGSPVLGTALRLVLQPGDHAHSVTLLSDAGHFDLVMSHADEGSHDHAAAAGIGLAEHPASSEDHVFHLTSDDLLSATQRRIDLVAAAASVPVLPQALVTSSARGLRAVSAPRPRSGESLRTIVLRI